MAFLLHLWRVSICDKYPLQSAGVVTKRKVAKKSSYFIAAKLKRNAPESHSRMFENSALRPYVTKKCRN